MATRSSPATRAGERARQSLREAVGQIRAARRAAGLSQRVVAAAVGCSRQLIAHLEAGRIEDPGSVFLARVGAVVGLDVRLRAFPGGSAMRDAGQLELLGRFLRLRGDWWSVRTEVPVAPRDARAFDAVLRYGRLRVAVECITRLTDVQAQIRAILLKAEAAGISCIVLVLADTRWNRQALADAAPTMDPAFPLRRRAVLKALRAGEVPTANGVLLV